MLRDRKGAFCDQVVLRVHSCYIYLKRNDVAVEKGSKLLRSPSRKRLPQNAPKQYRYPAKEAFRDIIRVP